MEGLALGAGGPPWPPCGGRLQTTARCGGQEPFVLSVCRKVAPLSAAGVGQEGERKRSIDDMSKSVRRDQNRVGMDGPGGAWEIPVYCPGGLRHAGGASFGPGFGVERVNLSSRVRERPVERLWPAVVRGRETPKRLIRKGLSTDAGHRGGSSRSSDEGP